jgi:hypothetical protein
MNTLRPTVMAAAICAVGLSLAACTAAGSTAGPAKPAFPAGGRTRILIGHGCPQTAPGCTGSGGLVKVDAPVGSFPTPPGASGRERQRGQN